MYSEACKLCKWCGPWSQWRETERVIAYCASNTCSPWGVLNNFLVFHSITLSLISSTFAPPPPDILLASFYLLIKASSGGTFSGMSSLTILLSKAGLGIQFHALHHQGWQAWPYHLGCSIQIFLSFFSLFLCWHLSCHSKQQCSGQRAPSSCSASHTHTCVYV